MKAKIHPKWYPQAKITCACGASFTAGSTKPELHVEICSACHPFFTGEMRYIDAQGRVEKFQAKQKLATAISKKSRATSKAQKRQKRQKKEEKEERPRTLKEMLGER